MGPVIDLPVSNSISFRTGLLFSNIGTRSEGETMNLNYLDIPLELRAKYNAGNIKLIGTLGGYTGIGISGNYGDDNINFGGDGDFDYQRMDYGLNIGVGIGFKSYDIIFNYQHGIANLNPYKEGNKIKNRVFAISFTYSFPVKLPNSFFMHTPG